MMPTVFLSTIVPIDLDAGKWELRDGAGRVGGTFVDMPGATGYQQAAAELGAYLKAAMGAPDLSVLLPETWASVDGIAFSKELPGGRDFTDCTWSWRDPTKVISPLLLLTEETMGGHLGARLAGFTAEFTQADGTVHARGGLYNTDVGTEARDLLVAAEESGVAGFGVSVGPTENLEIEFEEVCTQQDDDGFCIAADLSIRFLKYEIGSLTMCAPAGFDAAVIAVERANADAPPAAAKIAASAPTKPPRAWFELAEPRIGEPFLDGIGDDYLVEQRDGSIGCPFEIRDNGQVFGHISTWGQCHVGNPWGPGICASVAPSTNEYLDFHKGGHVICDDGSDLPTGLLHVGCEHSPAMNVDRVRDDTAHAGLAFAQVRAVDGELGVWIRGALLPTVTDEQITSLRALTLSGDWVPELGAIIAVNEGGLPQTRRARIAASAGGQLEVAPLVVRASIRNGEVVKLIGGNGVHRCVECTKRKLAAGVGTTLKSDPRLAEIHHLMQLVEVRTRHLVTAEAAAMRARLER